MYTRSQEALSCAHVRTHGFFFRYGRYPGTDRSNEELHRKRRQGEVRRLLFVARLNLASAWCAAVTSG